MVAAAVLTMPSVLPEECDHWHRQLVAKNRIQMLLHNSNPWPRRARVKHYIRCVRTRLERKRLARHARAENSWRKQYPQLWKIRYNRLSPGDKGWAVSTSSCEAGMNPATNTGNGFYGAFQFMLPTWYSAGGTGNPASTTWHHQAVIAVRWRNIAGAGQWPVCGR